MGTNIYGLIFFFYWEINTEEFDLYYQLIKWPCACWACRCFDKMLIDGNYRPFTKGSFKLLHDNTEFFHRSAIDIQISKVYPCQQILCPLSLGVFIHKYFPRSLGSLQRRDNVICLKYVDKTKSHLIGFFTRRVTLFSSLYRKPFSRQDKNRLFHVWHKSTQN